MTTAKIDILMGIYSLLVSGASLCVEAHDLPVESVGCWWQATEDRRTGQLDSWHRTGDRTRAVAACSIKSLAAKGRVPVRLCRSQRPWVRVMAHGGGAAEEQRQSKGSYTAHVCLGQSAWYMSWTGGGGEVQRGLAVDYWLAVVVMSVQVAPSRNDAGAASARESLDATPTGNDGETVSAEEWAVKSSPYFRPSTTVVNSRARERGQPLLASFDGEQARQAQQAQPLPRPVALPDEKDTPLSALCTCGTYAAHTRRSPPPLPLSVSSSRSSSSGNSGSTPSPVLFLRPLLGCAIERRAPPRPPHPIPFPAPSAVHHGHYLHPFDEETGRRSARLGLLQGKLLATRVCFSTFPLSASCQLPPLPRPARAIWSPSFWPPVSRPLRGLGAFQGSFPSGSWCTASLTGLSLPVCPLSLHHSASPHPSSLPSPSAANSTIRPDRSTASEQSSAHHRRRPFPHEFLPPSHDKPFTTTPPVATLLDRFPESPPLVHTHFLRACNSASCNLTDVARFLAERFHGRSSPTIHLTLSSPRLACPRPLGTKTLARASTEDRQPSRGARLDSYRDGFFDPLSRPVDDKAPARSKVGHCESPTILEQNQYNVLSPTGNISRKTWPRPNY
ncbi:hypothetical protein CC78DRAFT_584526 [Lojkania enalia]|uniref:Uncharacterized protein n=1 Tax=Lojkania enalia TaxID=147567 RepID=A0A9P4N3G5_9PLEO|nr:hypothetical protein CC78DRAFT_584526 [Didymosphaeria enalia]